MTEYSTSSLVWRRRFRWLASGASFCRNKSGGILTITAFALPAILGLSGLGLDASTWYLERRVMQTALDAAALDATHAMLSGADQTELEQAVQASLAQNAFNGGPTAIVDVNRPPLTGPNTADPNAVEVVMRKPANLFFTAALLDDFEIAARAVGGTVVVGEHCIFGLDHEIDGGVEFAGTADADIGCGVVANSRSDRAILVSGTATLTADPAQAFGDISVEGNAQLITNQPPQPHAARVADPYGPEGRNLQIPDTSGLPCDPLPSFAGSATVTIGPGHYCDDIRLNNDTLTMLPGTYILNAADFVMLAASSVTGTGITIILTADDPDDVGVFQISSGSLFNLEAPSTGEFAGVLIFEDPNATSSLDGGGGSFIHDVQGGATTNIKGAIYTPNRELQYTGGAGVIGQCVQLVARKVTITGNTVIDNDPSVCESLGLEVIEQERVRLVE
jgi:hypothetical protein